MTAPGRTWALVALAALSLPVGSGVALAEGTVVIGRAGSATFNKTDGAKTREGQSTAYSFEVMQYIRLDRAVFFAYRNFSDPESKRDAYQAAYGGFRYFPLAVGRPIDEAVQETHVSYDSRLKVYVEGAVSFGRCLFEIQSLTADLSADTNGFLGGTGIAFFPASNIDVELGVSFEYFQARGGTADSLGLSGSNMFALLGTGLMF